MKFKDHLLRLLGAAAVVGLALPASAQITVYSNTFDAPATLGGGATGGLSGVTTLVAVPTGYAGVGFAGQMLRNDSGGTPQGATGSSTVVTLNNLPIHSSINISTLLAIIDSWDGENGQYGHDVFTIRVDGAPVFSESFYNVPGNTQTFVPSGGIVTLANNQDLGFTPGNNVYGDDAYSFALSNISHTSSSVSIEIFAGGTGWQGGVDESWGMDNFQVSVNASLAPEPATLGLLLLGGVGVVTVRRRKA